MEKPDVAMWDKEFPARMKEWVRWYVERTELDNLDEFMRFFMRYSKGHMNPKVIEEVWNESKRSDERTREVVEGSLQVNQQADQ